MSTVAVRNPQNLHHPRPPAGPRVAPRRRLAVPVNVTVLRSGVPDAVPGRTIEVGEGGVGPEPVVGVVGPDHEAAGPQDHAFTREEGADGVPTGPGHGRAETGGLRHRQHGHDSRGPARNAGSLGSGETGTQFASCSGG